MKFQTEVNKLIEKACEIYNKPVIVENKPTCGTVVNFNYDINCFLENDADICRKLGDTQFIDKSTN